MKLTFRTLLILLSLSFITSLPTAYAQEDVVVVCVEQYPCDDEGRLLEQYKNPANPCYPYSLSQCNAAMEQRMESLEESLKKAKSALQKARKLLRNSR